MPRNEFIRVKDGFFTQAKKLRAVYDKNFSQPLEGNSARFVWDYWHVPDQYTLIRTPAEHYFPKDIFAKFIRELTQWGQDNLGCMSISPPWLSYYVEGCEQKLHCDIPHGPWAFVYSLTLGHNQHFKGGETLIFKPQRLNYWENFSSAKGLELPHLVDRIPPKFNRLVVFDPRLPHAVTRVSGTQDPREARLVIHGWFTQPQPIIKGPIKPIYVTQNIKTLVKGLNDLFEQGLAVTGTQSYSFTVSPKGSVSAVQLICNTVVSRVSEPKHIKALTQFITSEIQNFKFPPNSKMSKVILPLIFE